MVRFLTGFLFLTSALILVYVATPVSFYLKAKQERLSQYWQKDIQSLSQKEQFKNVFSQLARVEVHFTDPQVAEEFKNFKTPFSENPKGQYVLKVSITRWIEAKEYGFIIEHELFDLNDDKLNEFGRTYKIGIIL